MRHQMIATQRGATVEQAILLDFSLAAAVKCGWLQSEDRGRTRDSVLAELQQLHDTLRPSLEAEVQADRPDYRAKGLEAFAEEDPHGYPRFGWGARYAVSEVRHWNDTCDIAAWNMGVRFAFLSPSTDHVPELHPAALHVKLRLRGVPLIVCDACEYPITSRPPRWPGGVGNPHHRKRPSLHGPRPKRDEGPAPPVLVHPR
ncbi:hypothetical protein IF129_20605 [Streptomyces chumphonensis]|uniref:Uncharacterized protein n=1 Tax=Streptomyces chumphonensis TaxID=1214925 RepID=A0A927IE95_9ACTN|nr:hypothetical protein [Streptomyces chumphonensis]MBD3933947.1 hypothetical protein [Streptomyces chumphonensis]